MYLCICVCSLFFFFFFFNDTATTEIYTLSLHDALPIWVRNDTYGAELLRHLGTVSNGENGALSFEKCVARLIGGFDAAKEKVQTDGMGTAADNT